MNNKNINMETFVSIVLILDKIDSSIFKNYLETLQKYLEDRYSDYEIIIIDQNKKLFPISVKEDILKKVTSIRWIQLAFPIEIDIALNAGIENAIGDFVLLLRPIVDPITIIEDMVEEGMDGSDVLIGIAERPRTFAYKIVRSISNKFLHSIDYHIPKNATPVRCLSRRAINTVLKTGKPSHQFFINVSNTGYPTKTYHYKLSNVELLKKQTLISGLFQGIKLMIFNSAKPLRWVSLLGIFGSLLAFIFALYSIVLKLIKSDVVEGWTSMVFFTSFLFMILFILLAFLGEYLARLLNEQSQQESYYISSEERSDVMLKTDRYNVLHQSEIH